MTAETSRANRLGTALSFGVVAGLLIVFFQASVAALVFSGPGLEPYVAPGTGAFLLGTVILIATVSFSSSTAPIVAYVQEEPAAVLSVMTAAMIAEVAPATADQELGTIIATMAMASAFAGATCWVLGRFSLGQIVRFLPYPVGGGFLAGTGWLVFSGGISVATGGTGIGPDLLTGDLPQRWLPALVFGVALLVLLRRWTHFLVLPTMFVIAIAGFHATYVLVADGSGSAEDDGWLLGPFPSGRMWQPDTVTSIADADWGAVFGQAAGFGAIVVVAIVALLLNYSGLETAMRTDIDVDAELRHTGLGNLVNGAAGCPPGFVAFGMSSLGHRLGARTRSGIIVTAGILVAVLAFGAGSIALVPRLVAGGFLVYLGLGLLREWLVATWTRVSKVDYALIWLILLAIVTIGFLAGIALGVFAAIAIFLVEYSRVGIIRTTTTRSHFASDAERPLLDERLLAERGDRIAIITIQGYVFFGTAHSLADRVRSMWRSDSSIRFLVIDFRLVTGMDVSGVAAFTRLCRDTRMADVTVALTGVSPDVRRQLTPEVLPPAGADESSGVASLFATLDDGVRWAEQQQLDDVATAGLADPTRSAFDVVRRRLGRLDADSVDWLDQLQPTRSRQVGDLVGMFDASLVRREFVSGEALAVQGRDVADLVVLVDGSAEWIEYDGEAIVDRGHVAPGSDVIARDLYAGGRSSRTVIATSDGSVLVLPADAIDSLDAEHPELAAVLHRTMTERISYRAYRLASASRFLAR